MVRCIYDEVHVTIQHTDDKRFYIFVGSSQSKVNLSDDSQSIFHGGAPEG